MKAEYNESQQMVDQKQQFANNWTASPNSWDHQPFFTHLFSLLKSDQKAEDIFLANLHVLLTSSHRNLQTVFQFCLSQSEKRYTQKLISFLANYFDQKKSYFLSFSLEKYLIHQIWKPSILSFANHIDMSPRKAILYLSMKMRSLDLKVRKEALCSLYNLVETVLGPVNSESQAVKNFMGDQLQRLLPEMIEKQKYGKQVHFSRGIILQILQDQFCEIKKKGIQFLGLCQGYFDIRSLRPLILYMLNDEHQIVRQTSLAVLSNLPDLKLQKEDLNALLVCLRQNKIELRSRTYKNIANINVTSTQDFLVILNKLFDVLLAYKEDKRKIYTTCAKLGCKYPNFILNSLDKIYRCIDSEQPNWKNLVYKARVILVACMGEQKWPKNLPKYFRNHYLYIRDVELYAFQVLGTKTNNKQISGSSASFGTKIIKIPQIYISSGWQLAQYCHAFTNLYSGFVKQIFTVLSALVSSINQQKLYKNMPYFVNQICKLQVQFNIQKCEPADNLLSQLFLFLKQYSTNVKSSNTIFDQLFSICQLCLTHQNQFMPIQYNVFKTRNYDRSKVIITNNRFFITHSFVQFSCSLGSHASTQANLKNHSNNILNPQFWKDKDFKFIRMSEVEFEQTDDRFCYFTIDFKWKRLRCMSIYGNPMQILTNDGLVSF